MFPVLNTLSCSLHVLSTYAWLTCWSTMFKLMSFVYLEAMTAKSVINVSLKSFSSWVCWNGFNTDFLFNYTFNYFHVLKYKHRFFTDNCNETMTSSVNSLFTFVNFCKPFGYKRSWFCFCCGTNKGNILSCNKFRLFLMWKFVARTQLGVNDVGVNK